MMTTESITHPKLVSALVKPPADIINSLTVFAIDLWHGATGVAGEAGELLETILFRTVEGVDRVNLREELGDLYFYIEQLVQRSGVKLDMATAILIAMEAPSSSDMALTHAASVAVHGSQVLDTVKKRAIYNQSLDIDLLTNQLTALVTSMLVVGYMFGLSREECLDANIAKLSKRYESLNYSDDAAQARTDKQTDSKPIPERRFFKGDQEPRKSDMADIVEASKNA